MSMLSQAMRNVEQAERAAEKLDSGQLSMPPTGHLLSLNSLISPPEKSWPDPLATEALHGLAGEIVRTIEPHTEADPSAILIQFLAAFGSIVGADPHYRVEADEHTGRLFALMVGDTAKGRKGTSWGHVKRLFEHIDDAWVQDRVMGGLSSGEGLIYAVRDEVSRTEKGGQVVTDPGATDKRLLVVESEFASCLRVMARDGNTLSAIIRQAWDNGNLRVLTKNNPIAAASAHIGIIGHITADELRRYLDRTEAGNGFANRFLFVCVKRSKCLPHGGSLTDDAVRGLARKVATAIGFVRTAGRIEMDSGSQRIWEAVYPRLSEGLPGLLGAVTSRAEAHTIRLALLYALLDRSPEIRTVHLKAALAVWDYAAESARYIFGSALGDPLADEILRALRTTPDGLTRTDISGLFSRKKDAAAIGAALEVLRRSGQADVTEQETGGRPVEIWRARR
jgi:hypothetical protein